ncbi:MAG: DNA internalization-related competence protein ComEC/Rec2 [Cellvibrionales bacterium]|nr:DNA internalization-related competence protein ComEC/Rec2 [Cellvibrionales bacterium]
MIGLLAYCLSFFIHSQQEKLLSSEWAVIFYPVFLAALIIHQQTEKCLTKKIAQAVIGFLLGYGWVTLYAGWQLQSRLHLSDGVQDVQMQVSVHGLIVNKGQFSQFSATIETIFPASLEHLVGQKVRLNFYHNPENTYPGFMPCDQLIISARLKPIKGLKNVRGFDYEAFAFSEGFAAKGYITELTQVMSASNRCLHKIRQVFRDSLVENVGKEKAAWLAAVTIGDRTLLSKKQNALLTQTGLMHLFVISGLHIGLIAGGIFTLILLIRRLGGGLLIPKDWRPMALVISLAVAVFYALMAGFSYPVQRALIGLIVIYGGILGILHASIWLKYWLVMAICLTLSPLAPLSKGFVLSFYAVFILLLVVHHKGPLDSFFAKLRLFIKIQISLFFALSPLQLMTFGYIPWLSPMINFFMIPLMTIAIIPLSLLVFVTALVIGADNWLTHLSADFLGHLMSYLEQGISYWPYRLSFTYVLAGKAFWVSLGTVIFLLTPWLRNFKAIVGILVLGLFLEGVIPVKKSPLIVDVLDVGQGLSILIRTPNHQLLYDTGAGWQGGSMGQWVILPVLNHYRIETLDKLVVSHLDVDHAGGAYDVIKQIAVEETLSSDVSNDDAWLNCHQYPAWQWDGVLFEFVSLDGFEGKSKNDQSCVLQVEYKNNKLLLTGDIEKRAEQWLLKEERLSKVNVLMVPHHGSNTSSTEDFLTYLSPALAINSSGFLNRYRHPHPDVVARYQSLGVEFIDTQVYGQIQLVFDQEGNSLRHYLGQAKGYYFSGVPKEQAGH